MDMTGRERMLTALSLGQPDRVPVWELAFNEESIINIGRLFTDDVPPVKLAHEMNMAEKNALSHRSLAVQKAIASLKDILAARGIPSTVTNAPL